MMESPVQIGGIKYKIKPVSTATTAATGAQPKEGEKPPTEAPTGAPTEAPTAAAKPTTAKKFKVKTAAAAPAEEKPIESGSRKDILEQFYKHRIDNPAQYSYGPDGNLVVLDTAGTPTKTIPMMNFRRLNNEEVVELSRERMERVRTFEVGSTEQVKSAQEPKDSSDKTPVAELSYVDALANLRDIYAKYKRGESGFTARAVKDANQKVKDALKLRDKALYPLKHIREFNNPIIKHILVDSRDERHIGYKVYTIKQFPFKKEDAYGHYVTPEEEAELARKTSMKGGSAIDVILIETYEDPIRGFLHPAYIKDFSYTSTQYSSVYQAFEVERLKMLRNQLLVDQLMKTRSPRTIASIAAQDKTPIANPYELWFSILKAFYQQNTDLAKQLVETGSAIFSLRDTTISSPSEYLNALMSVRSFIAEKQEGGAVAPVEKHAITEEEQKKAKIGAIINARRMG